MKIRKIPEDIKAVIPVSILYQMLREQEKLHKEEKGQFEEARQSMESVVCEIALLLFKNRSLDTGNAADFYHMLKEILYSAGVEIIDYTGQVVDEQLQEKVCIEGWDEGTQREEVVKETFTPEIRYRGKLLHSAQVFCQRALEEVQEERNEQETIEKKEEELLSVKWYQRIWEWLNGVDEIKVKNDAKVQQENICKGETEE